MKTAIKLTLIYFAMQILAALAVLPLCTLYVHITGGSAEQANELSIAPIFGVGDALHGPLSVEDRLSDG